MTGRPQGTFGIPAEQMLGQLNARLNFSSVQDILNEGLHEFIDFMQQQINDIGGDVHDQFFRRPDPWSAPAPTAAGQSQSAVTQSQALGGMTQSQSSA
ncbi:MAG: alpha-E domain-containing protein [Planctomycetaceae bacterium]